MAALIAWYSIIHVPDDAIGAILPGFRRVLRPGGLLLGFHVGDASSPNGQGHRGTSRFNQLRYSESCAMAAP